jgi:hypothetical protein
LRQPEAQTAAGIGQSEGWQELLKGTEKTWHVSQVLIFRRRSAFGSG